VDSVVTHAGLRSRLARWAGGWGFRDRVGMTTVIEERLRGARYRVRGLEHGGAQLRLGRGFAIKRFAAHTRVVVGNRVLLEDHVRLLLEISGAEIVIGDGSWLARRSEICAHERVTIGEDCAISWDVCIIDSDYHSAGDGSPHAPVSIGDRVWIGTRATVLKGVTVGDGAIIAAGAVVKDDIPARAMVAGVPARVVRSDVDWTP
jgi:acetyltransferase-like isoleucine patch superfamily enzyme